MKQQDKMILLDQLKSGTISSVDQRKLELAAMDDDFLFEAMEGFSSHSKDKTSTVHLSEKLAERVGEKTAKTRRMWLPMVGVAASLLVLASVFWWNGSSSDLHLADNNTQKLETTDDRSFASNVELENKPTTTVSGVPAKEPDISVIAAQGTIASGEEEVADQNQEFTEEQKRKSEELLRDFMAQKPTVKAKKVEIKTNSSAEVVVEERNDVEEETREVIIGDLNAEDYALEEVEIVERKEPEIAESIEADMVVATSIPPPSPVAVERKKESRPAAAKKRAVEEVKEADFGSVKYQFAPQDGWEKFDKYIDKKKSKSVTATHTSLKGKVIVEFTIGDDDYPKNITVVESVSTSLNEDAVKLIRFGGKWLTNDKTKVIRYVINY